MRLDPSDPAPQHALRRRALHWLGDAIHAQETGGLSWHWSAYRSRQAWQPTQKAIEGFLLSQKHTFEQLLLIGGSAGWMMSSAWLQQFKSIKIIDIDPLASLFFRLLHGKALKSSGTTWSFERRDALQELPILLKEHPKALVFFDNVLGQQCFRLKDEELVERLLRQIKVTLKGRSWGSVHDVYSGPIDDVDSSSSTKPPLITPRQLKTFSCQFGEMSQGLMQRAQSRGGQNTTAHAVSGSGSGSGSNAASDQDTDTDTDTDTKPEHMIINGERQSFDDGAQILLQAVNATGEWKDHLSVEVFAADTPSTLIPWFFKSNYCHWLQAAMVFA